MRVALFSDSYLPTKSGIVTVVIQLKNQLEKLGHEVFLVTVETTEEYATFDDHIYRARSIPLGLGTDQFLANPTVHHVVEFLRDKNIDVIHCHTEFGIGKVAYGAAKSLGIPCICTIHTMWVDFYKYYLPLAKLVRPGLIDKFMNHFYGKFNALIGVSTKARNYYKKPKMLPNKPSVVIPNSIDKEKFSRTHISEQEKMELKKSFGISDDEVVLLFVGRIGEEKRVFELLEQCQNVLKKCPKGKMIFVGNGPAYKDMVKKAKTEIDSKRIMFAGFVEWTEVHKFYESADIFVTASLSEMHSMTILEAMLCGMPIVTRHDESYLDSVIPGQNGYLAESDEELGDFIVDLVNDGEKRKRFGKKSLEITNHFSIESNVKKTLIMYEEVIKAYPDSIDEKSVVERFEKEVGISGN